VSDLVSVSVVAPDAATAEVAAKAALLLGRAAAIQALNQSDHLAAVLVPARGIPVLAGRFGPNERAQWEAVTP
jgi:thiamine biosynthesis lipoprotein ApbE